MNNDSSIPLMSLVIVFTATPWLNLLSHWGSAATLLTIAGRKMMLNHPWLFIANPLPPCGFMCFCAPYSVCCCRILECEITESPSPEISSCQEKAAQDWWMWQIMDEWEEEERPWDCHVEKDDQDIRDGVNGHAKYIKGARSRQDGVDRGRVKLC